MDKEGKKYAGRVGMLAHAYYPQDVRIRREAEALAEFGFETHVVCLKKREQDTGRQQLNYEYIKGVHTHRMPLSKKRGGVFRYLFEFLAITVFGMIKLTKMHASNSFDIIHVHNMPDILIYSAMFAKWTGAKILLDIHDPMSELFQVNYSIKENNLFLRFLKFQEVISYKFANHLITVSDPMRQNVSDKSGVEKEKITVVQNVPDLKIFPVNHKLHEWPGHKDHFTLLYAGTITEHYGLDIAVKAVAIACQDISNIRLLLIGEGNRIKQVLELGKTLKISDRIEYLKPVRHEKIKEFMAKADVGISTHRESAFGDLYFSNKLVEFLSQGLPVLTSKTKTVLEYLPEDSVFYFKPEDAEDCAQQLIKIYHDLDLVNKKMGRAREIVQRLNWQIEKEKFIKNYVKLLPD